MYERDETPQKRTAPDDTVERGMMGVVVCMERGRDRNDSYREKAKGTERERQRERHHSYLILGLESVREAKKEKRE